MTVLLIELSTKTCMAACPYNARYFKEETRAVDKCNFCYDTRLTKGEKDTACVAACPNGAATLRGLKDKQVFSMLESAL